MKKRITLAAFAALFSVLAIGTPAAATGGFGGLDCTKKTVPVKLAEGSAQTYNVVGWLCAQGSYKDKTLQVLVSGLTYDHTYWEFPYQEYRYSYVKYATAAGYATFNIDRIGVGESSKAPAADVTVPSEAFVANQIVNKLKDGQVVNHKFKKVVGVGHSMGAGIWMIAASKANTRVDGLILTDYAHASNLPFVTEIGTMRHPVENDPKFANAGLPAGYLTSKPGTRGYQFYNQSFADPNVIAKDEALKATATIGEVTTIGEARNPVYSQAIKVPVLYVMGQKDSLFCDEATPGLSCANTKALRDRVAPLFSATKSFTPLVIPKAGHDTNLHYNAPVMFAAAQLWTKCHIDKKWCLPLE